MTCLTTRTRLSLTLAFVTLLCVGPGLYESQTAYCDNGSRQPLPVLWRGWDNAIENNLPDNAIVALVDFKFEDVRRDKSMLATKGGWRTEAKSTGTPTHFISGTDDKKIELEWCIDRGTGHDFVIIKPDTTLQYRVLDDLEQAILSGEAKNCILVYKRNGNGSIKVLWFALNGADLAPAYEWLEATKDRKDDRAPLSVMVLMDKTAPMELRYLAYRNIIFSRLSVETRLEIVKKASTFAPDQKDVRYGASMLSELVLMKHLSPNENASIIRYFLQGLAASHDVHDANGWLDALVQDVGRMEPKEYGDIATEIADAIEKHEVTPAPELPEEMAAYQKVKSDLLQDVAPKPPTPEEKPAPPADGANPPASGGENPPPSQP